MAKPPARKTTISVSDGSDSEQFQRFLEKTKELGLDPTSEADLHRFDDVLRRVAKLPTQHEQPVKGDGPRGRKPRKPE